MTTWVALLRGVNVGGGNKVPMADLRKMAQGFGWTGVKSYIASGNLVFSADAGDHATRLEAGLTAAFGVKLPVLVTSEKAFTALAATCPMPDAPGNHVHAVFCWGAPVFDQSAYSALRAPDENLTLCGRVAWLHAPSGFGRSALAGKLEKVITGTTLTVRNWNTVQKLVDMSGAES